MARARVPSPGRKATHRPEAPVVPPRVRRRQKTAKAAVRKDTTLLQAPPPRHAIPGVMKRTRPIR
jgi:hypothetical protein